MEYIILDKTENTVKPYIDAEGGNCELLENAEIFPSFEAAKEKIQVNNWIEWADAKPLNEC